MTDDIGPSYCVGDRVKMADADDPRNIPAYRVMRGTVIEVAPIGRGLKVRWDDDREAGCGPDTMWRGAWTVALAEEGS